MPLLDLLIPRSERNMPIDCGVKRIRILEKCTLDPAGAAESDCARNSRRSGIQIKCLLLPHFRFGSFYALECCCKQEKYSS